ncbi:MAG: hypothetical protein WCX12_01160 [Candidatus Paceibacterota bacterium]|jgi:hypothetical protein
MSDFQPLSKVDSVWFITSSILSIRELQSSQENNCSITFSIEKVGEEGKTLKVEVTIDGISVSGVRKWDSGRPNKRQFEGTYDVKGIVMYGKVWSYFLGTFNFNTGKGRIELSSTID